MSIDSITAGLLNEVLRNATYTIDAVRTEAEKTLRAWTDAGRAITAAANAVRKRYEEVQP